MEAICDSGESVSCLVSEIYHSLKTKHSLKMEPSRTQVKARNQLPIETRSIVRLPVKIGGLKVEHKFHVLAKSEADCLIGLDFLEDHQCDPLFSKKKLRLNDDTCVPFYHKVYKIKTDHVFCVVAIGSVLVPASHSMIIPADITGWKRPPTELVAVFEPHERLKTENRVSADHVLFNFAGDMIPVILTNCGDEAGMIHRETILGQSELIEMEKIQNTCTLRGRKSLKHTDNKNAKYDLTLIKNSMDTGILPERKTAFSDLIHEFSNDFSKMNWISVNALSPPTKHNLNQVPDQLNSQTEGCPSITNKTYKKILMPSWKRDISRLVIARTVHQPCSARRKTENSA